MIDKKEYLKNYYQEHRKEAIKRSIKNRRRRESIKSIKLMKLLF